MFECTVAVRQIHERIKLRLALHLGPPGHLFIHVLHRTAALLSICKDCAPGHSHVRALTHRRSLRSASYIFPLGCAATPPKGSEFGNSSRATPMRLSAIP